MKKIVIAIISASVLFVPVVSFAAVTSINGLTTATQLLATTTATTTMHMKIVSSGGDTHVFKWDKTPWTVDQGGTGATSFTAGSVPFILGGIFSQDNANLFWDAINHALGIGTASPQHALDVVGALYSRLVTDSDSSSLNVDWNQGNVHTLTLSTSNTTLSFTNGQAGGEYKLILKQDSTGGRTVTWPGSVLWPGGRTPTLTSHANGIDMTSFVYDGTNYLGSYLQNFSSSTGSVTAQILVVGAGGAGGRGGAPYGGGGGGGQVVSTTANITAQAYSVTVGTGGSVAGTDNTAGDDGGSSSFDSIIGAGGMGGGGALGFQNGGASGSGNPGGALNSNFGGGGGGDSAAGSPAVGTTGGDGGNGTSNSISGASVTYGGGGGGSGNPAAGNGGVGGGGAGGGGNSSIAMPGVANTGGGGGGTGNVNAGAGGSGVVIISAPAGTITATGGSQTTLGGNDIWTFTNSGTFTVTSI